MITSNRNTVEDRVLRARSAFCHARQRYRYRRTYRLIQELAVKRAKRNSFFGK